MGSYENIVKIEEMRKKVDEGDLQSAQSVLDTMEIRKIKNIADLNLIAEVYEKNERYEEAVDIYIKIYEKTKRRKPLYHIIDNLIRLNNSGDAEFYLKQYQTIAPRDFYNQVFRYKIDKIKGESFEHLIGILEELKRLDYTEKWAYELAKLYYKAGMEKECIRECSDIELWFGEGSYVEKAKILKSYYFSGADKERIMEEIRRRSELMQDRQDEDSPSNEADLTGEMQDEPEGDYLATYEAEGDLYAPTDFMEDEEIEGFEYDLKRDVESILIHEKLSGEEEALSDYEEEDTLYQVNKSYEEPEQIYYEEALDQGGEYVSQDDYEAQEELPEEAQENRYEDDEFYSRVSQEVETAEEETLVGEDDELTQPYSAEERSPTSSVYTHEAYDLKADESKEYDSKEQEPDEDDRKLMELEEKFDVNLEEIFGNFLPIVSVKKQIVKSLDLLLHDRSKTVMMMITGTEGSGKTTLAKDMALFLYNTGKLKSSKVAKIKAEKLNSVDLMSKKETLKDCCLVIENASDLKRGTIDNLLELTQLLKGNIAVIFEENKKNMNRLFRECPKLMDLLKNRIHLPQYTQEDLMGFAFACLRQKDYRLNPKAENKLLLSINQIAKQSEPHTHLAQIYDLMQNAMNEADLRIGRQLSNLATQGRLRDVEVLTILAEDIIITSDGVKYKS